MIFPQSKNIIKKLLSVRLCAPLRYISSLLAVFNFVCCAPKEAVIQYFGSVRSRFRFEPHSRVCFIVRKEISKVFLYQETILFFSTTSPQLSHTHRAHEKNHGNILVSSHSFLLNYRTEIAKFLLTLLMSI
jgi:hypothetical protein